MSDLTDFGQLLREFFSGLLGSGRPVAEAPIFERNNQAEIEVRKLLDDLRAAFDRKDLDAIVRDLADDFTSYELLAEDGRAITTTGKQEAIEYLKTLFPPEGSTQSKELTVGSLYGTANIGVVTEDGDVVIALPDGTKEHQPLRATAIAARGRDGWKWLHWHMSESAPRFRVRPDGPASPPD